MSKEVPAFMKADKLWLHLLKEDHITNSAINAFTQRLYFNVDVGSSWLRGNYRVLRPGPNEKIHNTIISSKSLFFLYVKYHEVVSDINPFGHRYHYPAHVEYQKFEMIGDTTIEDVEHFMVVALLSVEGLNVVS